MPPIIAMEVHRRCSDLEPNPCAGRIFFCICRAAFLIVSRVRIGLTSLADADNCSLSLNLDVDFKQFYRSFDCLPNKTSQTLEIIKLENLKVIKYKTKTPPYSYTHPKTRNHLHPFAIRDQTSHHHCGELEPKQQQQRSSLCVSVHTFLRRRS